MARHALRTTLNFQDQSPRDADFGSHGSGIAKGGHARDLPSGFTIVELLIVVVVIAILAAITIVAYSGITDRAKNAAAASAAEQAVKKVLTYATLNSDQYPATMADAGVSDGSATYQYRVNNSLNPKTFCLTATTQNVSYFVSSTALSPTQGACAGHGANGVAAITNYSDNPGVEINAQGWTGYNAAPVSRATADCFAGSGCLAVNISNGPNRGPIFQTSTDAPSSALLYYAAYVKGQAGIVVEISSRPTNAAWAYLGEGCGKRTVTLTGAWQRIVTTTPCPLVSSGTGTRPGLQIVATASSTTTLMVDNVMISTEAVTQYSDGSTPGWMWNGSPNNSTSTGPPL
jgi:prepilin-type N-terminal cleavage/methylation domain-containing protein